MWRTKVDGEHYQQKPRGFLKRFLIKMKSSDEERPIPDDSEYLQPEDLGFEDQVPQGAVNDPLKQRLGRPFQTTETLVGWGGGTIDFESGFSLPRPEGRVKMEHGDEVTISADPRKLVYNIVQKGTGVIKSAYEVPKARRKELARSYVVNLKALEKETGISEEEREKTRLSYAKTLATLDPVTANRLLFRSRRR